MAASICVDTFVLRITADADCDLALYADGETPTRADQLPGLRAASNADASEREFSISPGNEGVFLYFFAYVIGSGFNRSHSDFGFSATDLQDLLSGTGGQSATGNKAVMSISDPLFNPPVPDTTGGPRDVKYGTLRYTAACRATFPDGNGGAAQNLSGEITLNTGVAA